MPTTHLWLATGLGILAALPASAKDADYIGTIQTIPAEGDAPDMARGTVFLDANRNSRLDGDEAGLEGVTVSNGIEVTVTDAAGAWALPVREDMNVFVTKPAGYATPVNAAMIPQFAYIHKPAGSPEGLRYGGLAPTGPLPAQINFPLVEDGSGGGAFECLILGDPQPYNNAQVSYLRETAGRMLASADLSSTECLVFEGDIMGDDLSLYPRFAEIVAVGRTPQYWVAGNHDVDFDATEDRHSFDTFRREWGPEYYSFDIGEAHFVVLDNVRYPCNGVDPHAFCAEDEPATYNGVVTEAQLDWLRNDLASVPEDKLIVLNQHISLQSFTDGETQKHQTDNLPALVEILGDRPIVSFNGHTHTVENILPGEHYEGFEAHTGIGPAPFHMIVAGALSGSWFAGEFGDDGVPEAIQRLGAPRGYFRLDVDGTEYVETYLTFRADEAQQFSAAFNTPRFRTWYEDIVDFARLYGAPTDTVPPVTTADLGDRNMITRADLAEGTWLAVNVWAGSRETEVQVAIDGGEPILAARTQAGEGEAKSTGAAYADPWALARQGTDGRMAYRSSRGADASGYEMFTGERWAGVAGPLPGWMLANSSQHLWRADLPRDLPAGVHTLTVTATDRHGRAHVDTLAFEVVEEIPSMVWDDGPWSEGN